MRLSADADPAPLPAGRIRTTGIAILIVLAVLLWWEPPWLARLQGAGFDAFQTLTPRPDATPSVTIVEIDEKSIAKLGQWPWPRTVLAGLVREIARGEPAAIGIDILMPEPDRLSPEQVLNASAQSDPALAARLAALPSNDAEFARAILGAPVVLALAGRSEATGVALRAPPIMVHNVAGASAAALADLGVPKFAGVLGQIDEVDRAAAGRGLISVIVTNGVIRRMPLVFDIGGTHAPGFAIEMLRVAQHAPALRLATDGKGVLAIGAGAFTVPTERDGALRLYYGHRDPQRYVSAVDVVRHMVDPARFRGRFVVIGATGAGLADQQNTPLGEPMPGAEIQAQLLENIVDGTWLRRPLAARAFEIVLFVALGGLLIWAAPRFAPRNAAALAIACVVAPLAAAFVAFRADRWLFDAVTPGLALVALFLSLLFLTLRDATRHRKSLEHVLQVSRESAARVAGEIAAAQRIQVGMLPAADLLRGDRRIELAAVMVPARDVGGDLYDYFRLDSRRLFFLIGDVAGKGLSASIFMAVSKALYKSMALRSHEVDVGALMAAANVEVSRDNPESLFVTAFAGVLDLQTGELSYCNAGHENPYVLAAGGHSVARITDGDGPPLCAVDGYPYHGGERRMRSGEILCLITDGVTDASNARGEFYGGRRVEACLRRFLQQQGSARAIVDALRADVEAHTGGADPADDLTVLALCWKGPGD